MIKKEQGNATKLIIEFAIHFFLAAFCNSCNSYDFGNETDTTVEVSESNASWEAGGVGLLVRYKCGTCHVEIRPWYAPSNVPISYDKLTEESFYKNKENTSKIRTILARVFDSPKNPMPPNFATSLSEAESKTYKKFIETQLSALGPESGGCESLPKTTTSLTYENIKVIQEETCLKCHKTGAQAPTLDTREALKKQKNNMVVRILNQKNPMPPSNPEFGKSQSGQQLTEWLCFGADNQ